MVNNVHVLYMKCFFFFLPLGYESTIMCQPQAYSYIN